MISDETKKWIMLAEYKRISNKKKMELLNKYRNIYDVCNKLKIKEDYRINNCIAVSYTHLTLPTNSLV